MTALDLAALDAALDALPKRHPGPGGVAVKTVAGSFVDAKTGAALSAAPADMKPVRLNNAVRRAVQAALGGLGLLNPDPAKRTELYKKAQVIFKEQAPWATIAHSVVFQPIRKEVVDWKIDPFGGNIFYGVDLK